MTESEKLRQAYWDAQAAYYTYIPTNDVNGDLEERRLFKACDAARETYNRHLDELIEGKNPL